MAAACAGDATALAPDVTTRVVEHAGGRYRVVTVDLSRADLVLVGQKPGGPHRSADLASMPAGWVAATNSGLYHALDRAVGLHVEADVVFHPLELGDGAGNFFLKPNGVFTVDAGGARIVESTAFASPGKSPVVLATSRVRCLLRGAPCAQARIDASNEA